MLRYMCRAKIHKARVVETNLNYEGSITIAKEFLEAAGMLPNEMVQVININTGSRFETYIIEGEEGCGVSLNGGAARLGEAGDLLIILSYAFIEEKELDKFTPRVVVVDKDNRIIESR